MTSQPFLDQRMFLGANPLFAELSDEDLGHLVTITEKRSVEAGRNVVKQGEPGSEMYFILTGKVKVSVQISDGEEVTLGYLGPGEAFGEIALFDEQERTATVTTCEPSAFLSLNREPFIRFLIEHPHVSIQVLAAMSRRFRKTNDLIKESLYLDVCDRLAGLLRNLMQAYGKHTRSGMLIDSKFSEQELGEIAGLPSDVVAAQLKHWESEGVINTNRGFITVIEPEGLAQPR
jgi:CRP/FNR family transcriptional regulator